MLELTVQLHGKFCSYALKNLHEKNQKDYGGNHHQGLVAVVAVVYGNLSESSSTDYSAHRSVTEDCRGRYGQVRDKGRDALRNKHLAHNLHGGRS